MSQLQEKLILSSFRYNNSKNCCLAPHSTLNFDSTGKVRVCCYNDKFILGRYPETSVQEAWNNKIRKPFIKALERKQFPAGCDQCKKQILQNNEKNALFASYDWADEHLHDDYPIAMTFEFGTICNYECIMCGGKWSSSIRKNREKLPTLKHPYDETFVEQLKEFIPFLKVGNFLGGEPFLNPIYYKIWDLMSEINPKIALNITTNGSVYSSKIETYIKKFELFKMAVSLDSLDPKTYSFIRKNGNLTTVLENLQKFKKLNALNGLAFCPMIQNVYELPNIIHFCIINELDLYINDVTNHLGGKIKGIHENETENEHAWIGDEADETETKVTTQLTNLIPEVALSTLPKEELSLIIKYLKTFSYEKYPSYHGKYQGFINKLQYIVDCK